MTSNTVYRYADKALKRIYPRMRAEFQNASIRAAWDELNVTSIRIAVNTLYQELDTYLRGEYLWIAEETYKAAEKETQVESEENRPDAIFIIGLLDMFDRKTQYQYSREWERKRDRLVESMMAVGEAANTERVANSQDARVALKRALDVLERQVREMVDTVTDESRAKAFRDAGIQMVEWRSQEDPKVCVECQLRNRKIYRVDRLPRKHPRCRCYLVPASNSAQAE